MRILHSGSEAQDKEDSRFVGCLSLCGRLGPNFEIRPFDKNSTDVYRGSMCPTFEV